VLNDVLWEELEGHSHVLASFERQFEIHVFLSAPPNVAPGVQIALLHIIFAETILAVRVVSLYG
jgi:hypothetical protein